MFSRPDRIIVPQYAPPEGFSIIACAELLGESKRAVSAQLVDLAVRGLLGVQRGSRKREGFALHLRKVPADDGTPAVRDDLAVLRAVFPELRPGSSMTLAPATRRTLGRGLRVAHRQSVARLVDAGLVRQRGALEKAVVFWRKQPTEPTEHAHPLIDQLWGVRDYIAWAEADRLAFHQSPAGAEVRELDGAALLHLHERLLPFAVLFGLEKQWMRELDVRYEDARAELGDVVDAVGATLEIANVAVGVAELAQELPELGELGDLGDLAAAVDLGEVFDGIGAFFGGIGEFLSSFDI